MTPADPPPATIDEYLETVPPRARPMLERLRRVIREAAPAAEERISYRIPTFFHEGGLVAFHAAKEQCGFHLMSRSAMREFAGELGGYRTSVATIQFPYGSRIPVGLVKRIVRARVTENERRASKRARGDEGTRGSPTTRGPTRHQ